MEKNAEHAQDPGLVIQTIIKTLESPKPKLRYPVGKGVRIGILLKGVLPWHWWEKSIIRRIQEKE